MTEVTTYPTGRLYAPRTKSEEPYRVQLPWNTRDSVPLVHTINGTQVPHSGHQRSLDYTGNPVNGEFGTISSLTQSYYMTPAELCTIQVSQLPLEKDWEQRLIRNHKLLLRAGNRFGTGERPDYTAAAVLSYMVARFLPPKGPTPYARPHHLGLRISYTRLLENMTNKGMLCGRGGSGTRPCKSAIVRAVKALVSAGYLEQQIVPSVIDAKHDTRQFNVPFYRPNAERIMLDAYPEVYKKRMKFFKVLTAANEHGHLYQSTPFVMVNHLTLAWCCNSTPAGRRELFSDSRLSRMDLWQLYGFPSAQKVPESVDTTALLPLERKMYGIANNTLKAKESVYNLEDKTGSSKAALGFVASKLYSNCVPDAPNGAQPGDKNFFRILNTFEVLRSEADLRGERIVWCEYNFYERKDILDQYRKEFDACTGLSPAEKEKHSMHFAGRHCRQAKDSMNPVVAPKEYQPERTFGSGKLVVHAPLDKELLPTRGYAYHAVKPRKNKFGKLMVSDPDKRLPIVPARLLLQTLRLQDTEGMFSVMPVRDMHDYFTQYTFDKTLLSPEQMEEFDDPYPNGLFNTTDQIIIERMLRIKGLVCADLIERVANRYVRYLRNARRGWWVRLYERIYAQCHNNVPKTPNPGNPFQGNTLLQASKACLDSTNRWGNIPLPGQPLPYGVFKLQACERKYRSRFYVESYQTAVAHTDQVWYDGKNFYRQNEYHLSGTLNRKKNPNFQNHCWNWKPWYIFDPFLRKVAYYIKSREKDFRLFQQACLRSEEFFGVDATDLVYSPLFALRFYEACKAMRPTSSTFRFIALFPFTTQLFLTKTNSIFPEFSLGEAFVANPLRFFKDIYDWISNTGPDRVYKFCTHIDWLENGTPPEFKHLKERNVSRSLDNQLDHDVRHLPYGFVGDLHSVWNDGTNSYYRLEVEDDSTLNNYNYQTMCA